LDGAVQFGGDSATRFAKGDSFYLMPGSGSMWQVEAGTRLMTAACELVQT
jgi:uncharacterized cupin superfamily protein